MGWTRCIQENPFFSPSRTKMNWHHYLLSHSDMWVNGVTTVESAQIHYNDYGRDEGRTVKDCSKLLQIVKDIAMPKASYRKLLVKLAAVPFFCGLFNQLNTLCAMAVLGHILDNDIIVSGFYPEFQRQDIVVPLSSVVNLEHFNRMLAILGMRSRIYDQRHEVFIASTVPPDCDLLTYSKRLAVTRKNINMDLGMCYNVPVANRGSDAINELYNYISTHLRFNEVYYRAASKLQEHLELHQYHTIHLRLESDTAIFATQQHVPHSDWLRNTAAKYIKAMEQIPTDRKIYAATSLSPSELATWQQFPTIITKPTDWREILQTSLPPGREINAIIDYIVACESSEFIGFIISTLSQNVALHRNFHGKPCILLL